MGENVRELVKVANKPFADCRLTSTMGMRTTKIRDFAEDGDTAKFVNVFTHESFPLYGRHIKVFVKPQKKTSAHTLQ